MKPIRRTFSSLLSASVAMLATLVAVAPAPAQAPPAAPASDAPTTIVIPYADTGPTAKLARALLPEFTKALGRQVVLSFRGGTGATLGTAEVAASRDTSGRTLLLHNIGMASAPSLYRRLPYHPVRDFEPVGRAGDAPMLLLGRADLPQMSARELWRYIRDQRGSLTIAYGGPGGAGQLCGLILERALGTKLFWVPFKGTGPALADLVARRSDMLSDQTTHTLAAVREEKVRALVIAGTKRIAVQPDIPTSVEAGMPQLQVTVWHGLFAPKGTPANVISDISQALRRAVTSPEYIAQMRAVGVNPATAEEATPAALAKLLSSELARWKPLIESTGQFAD